MGKKNEHLDSVKESLDADIRQLRSLRNTIINNKNILNKEIKESMIVTLNEVLSSLAQSNWKIVKIDPESFNKKNQIDLESRYFNFKKDKEVLCKMVFGTIIYEKLQKDDEIFDIIEILDWKKVEWFYLKYLDNWSIQININYINLKWIFTSHTLKFDSDEFPKQPKILVFTN